MDIRDILSYNDYKGLLGELNVVNFFKLKETRKRIQEKIKEKNEAILFLQEVDKKISLAENQEE